MQMDIFFSPWTHIVSCSWEYRNELHKYIVQSVLVQLFYLLKIRALEIRKLSNACFSVPFSMGLHLRITASCGRGRGICVNIGSVVSCTTTATGTRPRLSSPLDRGSRGVDFMLTCARETVVYTTKWLQSIVCHRL